MGWLIFGSFVLLLVAFYLMGGRHYVCIRRKDCCGMGCGCLFPKKVPDSLPEPTGNGKTDAKH